MIDIGADLQRAFDEGYEKGKADRPQGEWVCRMINPINAYFECSECGYKGDTKKYSFCPNCGCRMRGADDE